MTAMVAKPNRAGRVRVFDAKDIAKNITTTFKDRGVEYEKVHDFDWPDKVQQVGDSLGVAYSSDKWKPKDKSGKRDWEVYKHIAESRNRIFAVPKVIRPERDAKRPMKVIGPMVSLVDSTRGGKLLLPDHFSELGIFKEANVILHTEGTDDDPKFGKGKDDGCMTLSVKHGMLGASHLKYGRRSVPFLFVYTPEDGVYFIILGEELDIEKDGIVG